MPTRERDHASLTRVGFQPAGLPGAALKMPPFAKLRNYSAGVRCDVTPLSVSFLIHRSRLWRIFRRCVRSDHFFSPAAARIPLCIFHAYREGAASYSPLLRREWGKNTRDSARNDRFNDISPRRVIERSIINRTFLHDYYYNGSSTARVYSRLLRFFASRHGLLRQWIINELAKETRDYIREKSVVT